MWSKGLGLFSWEKRSVFVTGAAGMVGSWLVKRLLEEGASVVVLLHRSGAGRLGPYPRDRVTPVHGSVEDLDALSRAMGAHAVETVFHLAAQPLEDVAKLEPVRTVQTNVVGAANVLEAARQANAREVIFASSAKAYGASAEGRHCETDRLEGRFPYDVSKSCADLLCAMYAHTYGLPVAVLRFANIFGGADLNFSRLIPGAIRATLAGQPFRIASDGTATQDFLYVEDAVEACLTAASALAQRRIAPGEAINFSLESRMTVLEVVRQVLDVMNRPDLAPTLGMSPTCGANGYHLACDKARTVLGWRPRHSFRDGLKKTIVWYREHLGVEAGAAGPIERELPLGEQHRTGNMKRVSGGRI